MFPNQYESVLNIFIELLQLDFFFVIVAAVLRKIKFYFPSALLASSSME